MRLYESLYIFARYAQDIKLLFELIIDFGYRERKSDEWNKKELTHYITMYNTILLDVCSYIDEYNKHFSSKSELQFKDRILSVKRIARPAFKKINEWSGLKEYRNQMIAHNFRVNEDIFSFNKLGQYKAPRTYADIAMLRKYLMMVQTIIEAEFQNELANVNPYIKDFPVQARTTNYETIEDDLQTVVANINSLCEIDNKPYLLDINAFLIL
jgi:hypothetical protein